jgi:flagellar export protein FliJ
MRDFQFRLEKVLDWRRIEFERERGRFQGLVAERNHREAARAELIAARLKADLELVSATTIEGRDIAAITGYRIRLDKERQLAEGRLADCRARLEAQRTQMIEAQRRLRLLEKLRLRRHQQWRTEMDGELERFASEAHLARWVGESRALAARERRRLQRDDASAAM